jgi:hypothetical protein
MGADGCDSQMKFDSVLLAEGVTTDARGAFAVVGLNQRLIAVKELPTQIKLTLLAIFSDEPQDPDEDFVKPAGKIKVVVTLYNPGSVVIFTAASVPVEQAPKEWQDLPGFGNFIFDLPLVAETTGIYRVDVDLVEADTVVDHAVKRIYVIRASALNSADTGIRRTALMT